MAALTTTWSTTTWFTPIGPATFALSGYNGSSVGTWSTPAGSSYTLNVYELITGQIGAVVIIPVSTHLVINTTPYTIAYSVPVPTTPDYPTSATYTTATTGPYTTPMTTTQPPTSSSKATSQSIRSSSTTLPKSNILPTKGDPTAYISTNSEEPTSNSETGFFTSTSTPGNCSNHIANATSHDQCEPSNSSLIGAAVGVTFAVLFLLVASFLYFKYTRRSSLKQGRISNHLEGGYLISEDVRMGKLAITMRRNQSSLKTPRFSRIMSPLAHELPLDDKALLKHFTELDNRIMDHVVNYWRSGDITSPEYQSYINLPSSRNSWTNVLYQGRPLLANISSRIPVFRAILAYHVYTVIVDWRILTTEQQAKVQDEGNTARRAICRNLERSENDMGKRINIIYNLLERETRIHVSEETREDNLYQQSLEELAAAAVILSLKLGTQADDFKFNFRHKDSDSMAVSDSLAVTVLGEAVDTQKMEVVNEMGGTVRALIAPGVTRVSRNGDSVVRLAQVYTA
ncbi:hypothetical protein TWF694_000760 [Orbilia ellipsospora]|uniref:Uncharacterized protein n=1 Tax=Orbilia ellipsospora TaxID=2528407 RepID=A0AAV9XR29_9PEZI